MSCCAACVILIAFRQQVGQFSVGTRGAGHIQVSEVGHLAVGVDTTVSRRISCTEKGTLG